MEEQEINSLLFDEARDKYTEIAGEMAGDTLRTKHKAPNSGQGFTKLTEPNMLRLRWHS